mmetsp:Transcript_57993/g.136449  ORF Transcript_57993/g.136449 Transcript_57993/m.136449 type:complete len:187 (-) Transcript_57993:9-569(-)
MRSSVFNLHVLSVLVLSSALAQAEMVRSTSFSLPVMEPRGKAGMAFSCGTAVDLELRDSFRLVTEAKRKSSQFMEEAEMASKRAKLSLQRSMRRTPSMVEMTHFQGAEKAPQLLLDPWVEFRDGDKLEVSYPVCPDPADSEAWIVGGANKADKAKVVSRFGTLEEIDARMKDLEAKLTSKLSTADV